MKRFVVSMAVAVVATSAAPARELSAIPGVQVFPLRVAQVYPDGSFGPWKDYVQPRNLLSDTLVFDCAEPDVDGSVSGIVGAPIGFLTCGLGDPEDPSGNRWFFGSTYDNPFVANDMTAIEGSEGRDVNDLMFGWYWGGPANVDRNCFLIVATLDSNAIADNDGECDTPVQRDDPSFLGGVLIDFGPVTGNPGLAYYNYAIVEGISTGLGISMPIPTDRIGVYHVILGTYAIDPTIDGVLDDTAEGGTQMMLWGTGDAEAIGGRPDNRPGTQDTWQWDDDWKVDGFHQAPEECYAYPFSPCPDPLGAMMAMWVAGDLCPCDWDLDADCDTDFADLTALLAGYGTSYDFQDIVDLLAEFGCTD